jgi:hypothetical protein
VLAAEIVLGGVFVSMGRAARAVGDGTRTHRIESLMGVTRLSSRSVSA